LQNSTLAHRPMKYKAAKNSIGVKKITGPDRLLPVDNLTQLPQSLFKFYEKKKGKLFYLQNLQRNCSVDARDLNSLSASVSGKGKLRTTYYIFFYKLE
jgi:hypothetical protein